MAVGVGVALRRDVGDCVGGTEVGVGFRVAVAVAETGLGVGVGLGRPSEAG